MSLVSIVLGFVSTLIAGTAFAQAIVPDALLAVDRNRPMLVERIVAQWGDALANSPGGIKVVQLREMLGAMRADHLLAASLAGSLADLHAVVAGAPDAAALPSAGLTHTKTIGDAADDVSYTPVTPCRLVETRGTFVAVYQGGGAFSGGTTRTYTAQGGNGVCLTQLPAGLHPSALQLQVFGIPINPSASGDIEILPQGSTFGATATEVYVGNVAFNTVSTTAKVNLVNNQVSVQVRGGGAHLAIDVVGYFKAPGIATLFKQGGNTLGTTALLGTTDNHPLDIEVNGARVMHYTPYATNIAYSPPFSSPNLAGGHSNNTVDDAHLGQVIAGGGGPGSNCPDAAAGTATHTCGNQTTQNFATVSGGSANVGDGANSVVAGGSANTASGVGSSIGGGTLQWASGNGSTISGGDHDVASGAGSVVGGGSVNAAAGQYGTVGGGLGNKAAGLYGTVAGGFANSAGGTASFAAGQGAVVTHNFSFLWCDGHAACDSQEDRDFIVVASGGIKFYAADGAGGCLLNNPAGQGWVCSSDRNLKENFVTLDSVDVLRRVAAMPITRWNVKSAPKEAHIGPVAQDFYAGFGLGGDDLHIASGDLSGVALAAIQGLDRIVQDRDREVAVLRERVSQLEGLRAEVDALRVALERMSASPVRTADTASDPARP